VQALKRNQSSDSSVTINGDVITKGDAAIGSNARIIKAPNEKKKPYLFEILVGLVSVIAGLIAIYKFITGK
jgi:hypothetical protein